MKRYFTSLEFVVDAVAAAIVVWGTYIIWSSL